MGITTQKKTALLTLKQFAAIIPSKRRGVPGIHKQNLQNMLERNRPLPYEASVHKMGKRAGTIVEIPITVLKSLLDDAIIHIKGKRLSAEETEDLEILENLAKEIAQL